MKKYIVYNLLIILFFCCCSKDKSVWTPKYALEEAERRLLSDCDTIELPVFPQIMEANNKLDPFEETLREVENNLNIPPLIASEVPKGVKEVRIIIGRGYLYPQLLFRLVIDGTKTQGSLYAHWPSGMNIVDYDEEGNKLPSFIQAMAESNCKDGKLGDSISTCRYCFKSQYDWQDFLKKLEENNIWDLPNGPERFTLDGDWLLVHLYSNGNYRSYLYQDPDLGEDPESKAALAIMQLVQGLRRSSQ